MTMQGNKAEKEKLELQEHYQIIIKKITDGSLVFFLGAGVNLCDRLPGQAFEPGKFLPSGKELAAHLAKEFSFPLKCSHCGKTLSVLKVKCAHCKMGFTAAEIPDLLRVSEYVSLKYGLVDLYRALHRLFAGSYAPTSLHTFIAHLPCILKNKGYRPARLLVVTTNYDDLMERAFVAVGQPFEMLTYAAQGTDHGKFLYWPSNADRPTIMPKPVGPIDPDHSGLSDEYPIILKVHGAINLADAKRDHFVIQEDDYIDYMVDMTDICNVLPTLLVDQLKTSSLLFLGYSLTDWNLRVILHRIWKRESREFRPQSWSIQLDPNEIDRKLWERRNVEFVDLSSYTELSLQKYVAALNERVQNLPESKAA